jgi:hypothetical protein
MRIFRMPLMIIQGSMTVTLIQKLISPTIQNFILHWKHGLAAQHFLPLSDQSCRPG